MMLVISGSKIMTMGPEGTLHNKHIIVEGDSITAINEADIIPANAQHQMCIRDRSNLIYFTTKMPPEITRFML